MVKPGGNALKYDAVRILREQGYAPEKISASSSSSRNIYRIKRTVVLEESIVIQCRSHQDSSNRYLLGIIMAALDKVDWYFIYLQDEDTAYMIPSDFLRCVHEECMNLGDAAYTGPADQQWRVDIILDENQLTPQGSNGRRYDISRFSVDISRSSKNL